MKVAEDAVCHGKPLAESKADEGLGHLSFPRDEPLFRSLRCSFGLPVE
ncbi:hypothetical protein SPRA44_760108 [Serratia proteamaculans]|nr:hypothetical protein SPRA44_760108 [Serratia proteamaculans]